MIGNSQQDMQTAFATSQSTACQINLGDHFKRHPICAIKGSLPDQHVAVMMPGGPYLSNSLSVGC